jgi:negative modulator of initiation of replication
LVARRGFFNAKFRRFAAADSKHPANRFSLAAMKMIEVRDEVYVALQRLASGFHRTPDEVLASLLNVPKASAEATEPLAAFILSSDFRAKFTDADKYLALLGWTAARHAGEFSEFILSQSGNRRYLGMTRGEILETCRHNQARQIPGTHYWAIMNIDSATKSRFLARLLEYVGYREAVIEFACSLFGPRMAPRRGRLATLVA